MDIRRFFGTVPQKEEQTQKKPKLESKSWNVYTDGSTINNGKKGSYGGIGVFFNDNNPMNISEAMIINGDGNVTNNICELEACRKAILQIVTNKDFNVGDFIMVNTDSQYLINCITLWSTAWEKNGWLNKSRKPVKNKGLIREIKRLYLKYNVQFKHIMAHKEFIGEKDENNMNYRDWYGNMMADKLAVLGSKKNNLIA